MSLNSLFKIKNMKTISIVPLYPNMFKIIGSILILFFCILLIANNLNTLKLTDPLFLELGLLLSIILTIFSKEKIENDNTLKLRYTSFKVSFSILFSLIFGLGLVNAIATEKYSFDLVLIGIITGFIYLISLQIQLFLNNDFISDENTMSNFKNFPKFYLIYLISILFIFSIYFILN